MRTEDLRSTEDKLRLIEKNYEYTEDSYDGAEKDQHLIENSNQTLEQKNRDVQITRLLTEYVDSYHDKAQTNQAYKGILFTVSIILFLCLVGMCLLSILVTMVRCCIIGYRMCDNDWFNCFSP